MGGGEAEVPEYAAQYMAVLGEKPDRNAGSG